jgi:hypothetical protein
MTRAGLAGWWPAVHSSLPVIPPRRHRSRTKSQLKQQVECQSQSRFHRQENACMAPRPSDRKRMFLALTILQDYTLLVAFTIIATFRSI